MKFGRERITAGAADLPQSHGEPEKTVNFQLPNVEACAHVLSNWQLAVGN
jgi:hypothetical protein